MPATAERAGVAHPEIRDAARRGAAFTELGFGGAPLGNLYRPMTEKEARLTLDAAWAAGCRYFDTAPLYGLGLSETRLNGFLRAKPRGLPPLHQGRPPARTLRAGRSVRVRTPSSRRRRAASASTIPTTA